MEIIKDICTVLSLFISLATVCTLIYGFRKFLTKPRDTLAERVAILETKQKETDMRLQKGTDNFKDIFNSLEALQNCMSIIVDFEVSFCDRMEYKEGSAEITEARRRLRELASKK